MIFSQIVLSIPDKPIDVYDLNNTEQTIKAGYTAFKIDLSFKNCRMDQERTFKRYVLEAFASTKEFIEKNPFAGKTTSEFAIEAKVNRKQLQAAFRAFTGMGIQEYQLTQRMEQSRQLLKKGNSTIKAIAINCGYKSQRAFTTAFKRSFGLTPSEFQNCPTE